MTSMHLPVFLWLRWRLFVNQLKRGGIVSGVILAFMSILAVLATIGFFIGAVIAGVFGFPHLSSSVQLLIWDGLVIAFLFSWMLGLLQELQRSEAFTLDKFLHLPVSLTGVFVLNYLSSFVSITLMFFLPLLFGLS